MLRLVTKKKQVKGQGSIRQQLAELKDIFAVYDESGNGQLDQSEFMEALMAAGQCTHLPCTAVLCWQLDVTRDL